jgi:hypothetical protein
VIRSTQASSSRRTWKFQNRSTVHPILAVAAQIRIGTPGRSRTRSAMLSPSRRCARKTSLFSPLFGAGSRMYVSRGIGTSFLPDSIPLRAGIANHYSRSVVMTPGIRTTEIRVRGKVVLVPSAQVLGRTVIATGKWPKVASVQDEHLAERDLSIGAASFIQALKQTRLKADIFTFAQKLPDIVPTHSFYLEWDNLAVMPITTFSEWWERRGHTNRTAVRKAAKSGLVVKQTELSDDLMTGIVKINNETAIRQGKPFWHFNKSFDEVKAENSTYPERTIVLGAYYQDELIGVVRMICAGRIAYLTLFLSMTRHNDKRTANAMIAKAVDTCARAGMSHLVYGQYVYNDAGSSLTAFKRHNGFDQVLVPRYFIPLTWRGGVAMKLGLHRGFARRLPKPLLAELLRWRRRWYARRLNASEPGG